uniref:SUN domain-containing protein n=1 Tax=Panagrellus redivivus TaxID=6233 RepID=A0A7E4UWH1_PANRE
MLLLRFISSFLLICIISMTEANSFQSSRNTAAQTCSAIKTRHFFDLFSRKFPSAYRPFGSRISPDCNDDSNATIDGMCPSLLDFEHPAPTAPSTFFQKRNATAIDEGHKIATFEEWTRQKLEQEMKKSKATNIGIPSSPETARPKTDPTTAAGTTLPTPASPPTEAATPLPTETAASQPATTGPTVVKPPVIPVFAAAAKRNYASRECGSKVIDANPEAENRGAVLNDKEKDDYMRNPCKDAASKYLVIELCETIQTKAIEIANFELFSSSPKEFRLLASERYPTLEWIALGSFTAEDNRNIQSFTVPAHGTYAKFLRLELDTHYGKEHYCTLSSLRVYGISMVDEYEAEANAAALGVLDVPDVVVEEPPVTETPPPVPVTEPVEEKLDVIDIPPKAPTPKILPWQIRDCQKCEGSQYRRNAITTWLCYVFSAPSTCSLERDCIPSGSICARVGRSRAQARFLNLVMKPRAVCAKGHAPHATPPPTPTPVLHPPPPVADVVPEVPKKQTVITPPPTPQKAAKDLQKAPLPAGTTSHKESVFLKLNKRLAQLELNISLSSQYLAELSRQYVAQTEATAHNQAHLEKHLSESVAKVSTRLASQIANEINGVRQEMADLSHRFHRFVATERMHHMSATTAATFSNYFSGNCSEDTRDIALRTSKEKQWDDEIDLDVADGMWTTQQLVILVALMQTTTFLMMLMVMRYYNRHTVPQADQIEALKQQILRELLENNAIVNRGPVPATPPTTPEVPSVESTPTMSSSHSAVSSQSSPDLISSSFEQAKKKRKRRNKQSVNEANNTNAIMPPPAPLPESSDRWDSTSVSSTFSSISSGAHPAPKKKVSTTSRDSCFASDGTENMPPPSS